MQSDIEILYLERRGRWYGIGTRYWPTVSPIAIQGEKVEMVNLQLSWENVSTLSNTLLFRVLSTNSNHFSIHYSNVWELRGVHWAAHQDGPVEDCDRKVEREKHQWWLFLGPKTQHSLPPDSQADRRGRPRTRIFRSLKCTLFTMLVLYVKQIWVAFILLFNHALQVSSIKYLAKPLSTFHQINAYEEDGFLIIDMCASDDGQAISNYNVQNLRKSGEALDEVSRLSRGQCSTSIYYHFTTKNR